MNPYFEKLQPYLDRGMAISTATNLIYWDLKTTAPPEGNSHTSKVVGLLANEFYRSYMNDFVKEQLEQLCGEKEQNKLEEKEAAIVRELKRIYDELEPIPYGEYAAFHELVANAGGIWSRAREHNSFEEFAPALREIIAYVRRFAGYRKKGSKSCYDILLEDHEPGFDMERLDAFFDRIKEEVVPLVRRAEGQKKMEKLRNKTYNVEKQEEFCRWLAGYVGFDFDRGVIAQSAHPFTAELHNRDVRITNHFYENKLESAIFSVIHESGHAMYEMDIADDLTQTLAGGGVSMGMHESQSRFYENVLGRSEEFWIPVYPKLKEAFPEQLKEVSMEDFVKEVNQSRPGAIRVDADELTYPIHILIRYEIEKMIFEEDLKVEELPRVWREKYKEYLGVEPKADGEGVLQDMHWAGADFGYFPTYALGSAIAAQIYYYMESVMPLKQYLKEGNLAPIRELLKDKIHKYGKTKDTNTLLLEMTGEAFEPAYYIRYLKEKFAN